MREIYEKYDLDRFIPNELLEKARAREGWSLDAVRTALRKAGYTRGQWRFAHDRMNTQGWAHHSEMRV